MVTIRKNIFETNSSSTHSLVLGTTEKNMYLSEFKKRNSVYSNGIIRFSKIGRDEFGEIYTLYDKIRYIVGIIAAVSVCKQNTENKKAKKKKFIDYTEIPTDLLENNDDIKWFENVVRSVLSGFGFKFKGFDFTSYRNLCPDEMYEGDEEYCGGKRFLNGKKIWNPLDHEIVEHVEYDSKEKMFGRYSVESVLKDPKISILYYHNG